MLRIALATAATLLTAPAFADGLLPAPVSVAGVPAPISVSAPDWTGAYGGAQLGFMVDGAIVESGVIDAPLDGTFYGIFGGYRYDMGTVVVGGEVDLMTGPGSVTPAPGVTQDLTYDSLLRIGAEIGYDAGDALIYGTAGYAHLEASATLSASSPGYFVGIGTDYRVAPNVTLGTELLHQEFSDFSMPGEFIFTTLGLNVAFTF